ncbi:MAG: hypothetical protein K0U86_02740 [Planctomycetes bacterium]|nr:hypothetical protein [Planctomycetota bacterium]MCH9776288.1 hypothetical protein [Planctomycetota bacterium]MCH9792090.1 hypothetical protein [Planctomycetota bacterium]
MFSRLVQTIRHLFNGHYLTCTVTLLAFVAASVGIPLQPFGQPVSGCHCGEDLKVAGLCCCAKARQRGLPTSSCQNLPRKTIIKSCCIGKVASSSSEQSQPKSCCQRSIKSCCRPKSPPTSSESNVLSISACGCGGPSDSGILVNAQPRISSAVVMAPSGYAGTKWCPLSDPLPTSQSILPETPPPEVRPFHYLLA